MEKREPVSFQANIANNVSGQSFVIEAKSSQEFRIDLARDLTSNQINAESQIAQKQRQKVSSEEDTLTAAITAELEAEGISLDQFTAENTLAS